MASITSAAVIRNANEPCSVNTASEPESFFAMSPPRFSLHFSQFPRLQLFELSPLLIHCFCIWDCHRLEHGNKLSAPNCSDSYDLHDLLVESIPNVSLWIISLHDACMLFVLWFCWNLWFRRRDGFCVPILQDIVTISINNFP